MTSSGAQKPLARDGLDGVKRLSTQQVAAVSRASTVAETVAVIAGIKAAIGSIKAAQVPRRPTVTQVPLAAAVVRQPPPPVPKPDQASRVLSLIRAANLPGFTRSERPTRSRASSFNKNVTVNRLQKLVRVTGPEN